MRLTEAARPGESGDFPRGGERPGGRLLSVAELQQDLRDLLTGRHLDSTSAAVAADQVGEPGDLLRAPGRRPPPAGGDGAAGGGWARGDTGCEAAARGGDTGSPRHRTRGDTDAQRHPAGDDTDVLHPGWVTVVAAHPGAGASTVALAISDAAAATGRRVHLVEACGPAGSGLTAAASAELGLDDGGDWRRGSRGRVTIDRRACCSQDAGWPPPARSDGDAITVVDLGAPTLQAVGRLAAGGCRTVVVARLTVPGLRRAEQLLATLAGQPAALAVVGTHRWPGAVTASLGPLLRGLRATRRIVSVPLDRRLEITGPTDAPLPKPVRTAGGALLELLDATGPGATTGTPSAPSAPNERGSTQ